ncbi:hypothetical protein [Alloprevotella tannerae]
MNNVYDDQMAKKALSTDAARSRKKRGMRRSESALFSAHYIDAFTTPYPS